MTEPQAPLIPPLGLWFTLPGEEHLAAAIKQLASDSDRAAAIVAAAILETRLLQSIKKRTLSDKAIDGRMFASMGALGAFSAKIDLAYMLGIINPDVHQDLHTIRRIPNRFAHHLNITDFSSQGIADMCASLKVIDRHAPEPRHVTLSDKLASPRGRYILSTHFFLRSLSLVHPQSLPAHL
jgi:DNA-binding MltR family transcriptional regulator